MDDKKQALYNAIADKYDRYVEAKKVFGSDHHLTQMYFREMVGLKKAFEIVFGITDVDYFIEKTEGIA